MQSSLFVLLAFVIGCSYSLRCYDYVKSNQIGNPMKTWVDCPFEAQYCFKSLVESRDFNNEKTWVENRSCGTPNLCVREGCQGSSNNKGCCCRKDLCNSSSGLSLSISIVGALLAFVYSRW